jgi:acetyl-CoA carboxylase biotin carboxyl carrier protein
MPTKKKPATQNGYTDVDALAALLRKHDLSEIEVEEGGRRILVRRGGEAAVLVGSTTSPSPTMIMPTTTPTTTPTGVPAAPSGSVATGHAETSDGNVSYITSPFVGTFYRSPSPESAPFIDVGSRIKKGQVICIIEAMKLMNEIESELEGAVVQILVENGHPVEYGEPLFKIKVG